MVSLSVIIPAYNEEGNIAAAVGEVVRAVNNKLDDYEIIIINDHSNDRTGSIAEELSRGNSHIKVVHNARNMGLGYNYKKGVELAEKEYVVMFPGDNEVLGKSIENMSNLIGKADIIIPYTANLSIRPLFRQIVSRVFTTIWNIAFNLRLKYYNGCVIHKSTVIKAVPMSTFGFAYQAEILVRLLRSGHSFIETEMFLRERAYGSPKAFSTKNIFAVSETFLRLLLEVHILRREKYNQLAKRVTL
jgi:glycosyltransferase involved in cell wall biosynthesis